MEGMGLTEAFGHLSERDPSDPSRFRITPAFGPGTASADKCISFDLNGNRLPGNEDLPAPLETPMHAAIYRARADVNAICRTHPPFAVSWGASGRELPCLHGFSLMLGRRVPTHPDIDLIHCREQADELAETLGRSEACLIRGNGALAVGTDVPHALVHSVYLEEAARIAVHLGCIEVERCALLIRDSEFVSRKKWHKNESARAWLYYCDKFNKQTK